MRRLSILVAIAAFALAACGDTTGDPATTAAPAEPATTADGDGGQTGTTSTTVAEGTSTTSMPEATSTTSGRPAAPDFTLELGDGGSYTLSEGSKPVYLVFWAEW